MKYRYRLGRAHEWKVMAHYRKYPRVHSARSLRVDVIVFTENGVTKLIECKRSSKDIFYLYPSDYKILFNYYDRLLRLGHKPKMVLSLWFPKRRVMREIELRPEHLRSHRTLKFELRHRKAHLTAIGGRPQIKPEKTTSRESPLLAYDPEMGLTIIRA